MTGPAMRSTPVTGPATSPHASSPTASYAPTTSTPAAAFAASYSQGHTSTQASTTSSAPASTAAAAAAAAHTGDYVSGEQYRYALTNFVRTPIQKYPHFHPPTDWPTFRFSPYGPGFGFGYDRPSRIRRSRNSGPSSKNRSGRSRGSRHA
jgi:hypothetical protein